MAAPQTKHKYSVLHLPLAPPLGLYFYQQFEELAPKLRRTVNPLWGLVCSGDQSTMWILSPLH